MTRIAGLYDLREQPGVATLGWKTDCGCWRHSESPPSPTSRSVADPSRRDVRAAGFRSIPCSCRAAPITAIAQATQEQPAVAGAGRSQRHAPDQGRPSRATAFRYGGLNAASEQSRHSPSLVPHLDRSARGAIVRNSAVGAAIPRRSVAPRSPRSKREGRGAVERAPGRTVLAGDRACGGRTPR